LRIAHRKLGWYLNKIRLRNSEEFWKKFKSYHIGAMVIPTPA
jgi:hypothetical protein